MQLKRSKFNVDMKFETWKLESSHWSWKVFPIEIPRFPTPSSQFPTVNVYRFWILTLKFMNCHESANWKSSIWSSKWRSWKVVIEVGQLSQGTFQNFSTSFSTFQLRTWKLWTHQLSDLELSNFSNYAFQLCISPNQFPTVNVKCFWILTLKCMNCHESDNLACHNHVTNVT